MLFSYAIEGFLGWVFFWDWLNVHKFDSRHRADKGWLRRDGWAEGWVDGWFAKVDNVFLRLGGFAKVDNRFGYEKWLQGGSIGLALL